MGTRYEYESAIDFSQLPKFLAILGVVTLIILVLKYINKKYNWTSRIEAATPWMEWNYEEPADTDDYEYQNATTRYPRNRENRFDTYC
jgi:uncharacterized membrane protein YkgB